MYLSHTNRSILWVLVYIVRPPTIFCCRFIALKDVILRPYKPVLQQFSPFLSLFKFFPKSAFFSLRPFISYIYIGTRAIQVLSCHDRLAIDSTYEDIQNIIFQASTCVQSNRCQAELKKLPLLKDARGIHWRSIAVRPKYQGCEVSTVCPRSYYVKWVTTSWTYRISKLLTPKRTRLKL